MNSTKSYPIRETWIIFLFLLVEKFLVVSFQKLVVVNLHQNSRSAAVMLIKIMPTMVFLLVWFIPTIVLSAASHKHVQSKERLEDGAFSPRDHDHFDGGMFFAPLNQYWKWQNIEFMF